MRCKSPDNCRGHRQKGGLSAGRRGCIRDSCCWGDVGSMVPMLGGCHRGLLIVPEVCSAAGSARCMQGSEVHGCCMRGLLPFLAPCLRYGRCPAAEQTAV